MTGAVCPSCGVAVLPGYVRCPKCRKPLPQRPGTHVEGGTAVEEKQRGPLLALVAAGVLGLGVLLYFGLRKDDPKPVQQTAPAQPQPEQTAPAPDQTPDTPDQAAAPSAPDPVALAGNLERALRKERLWATVSVVGDRVDVRSGSCSDAGMPPMLDAAAPSFKAAGLTKLRCLEQSGRVVTERDL